jgi:hypothetical protein
MIGFAIFEETHFKEKLGIYVHILTPKDRQKCFKKKILLAIKISQQRLRA